MVHPDRMLALLRESCGVNDPGLDLSLLLHGRQHHLAHFGQHLLIRPGGDTDKMQQRLVLRGRPRRSRLCRHRLHPLASARQHQAGAIIAKRSSPVRVSDYACKPFYIRRKSRFAVVSALEIHLGLRVPKSESRQIFDSLSQVLRPCDSVRLARTIVSMPSPEDCEFFTADKLQLGWQVVRTELAGSRSKSKGETHEQYEKRN